MYAVIKTGGQQYRIKEGDTLDIEKLDGTPGDEVVFAQVLMVSENGKITLGTPTIDKASVSATIKAHGKHKKIRIIKFRRRKNYLKTQGHRQLFTQVKIDKIKLN